MSDLEARLLDWAAKLHLWQRDLLRRLAQGDALTAADYRVYADWAESVELSKTLPWSNTPSLQELPKYTPLDVTHLNVAESGYQPLIINKITHLEGANDLAPGATIKFESSGLTIVAGRNGSGKSGYSRILKQVAASRGPEKVLPNAFKPAVPKAVISYQVGTSSMQDLTWQSDKPFEASQLQRVRVFDAKSATAQLADSNEVAFIPSTLQVLADYTSALKIIGDVIKDDIHQATLSMQTWPELEIGCGLEIFEHLGKKSGLQALKKLTPLSEEETKELSEIPGRLQVLNVSDPAKMAIQASSRAGQLSTLARNLSTIASGLCEARIKDSIITRQRVINAKSSVEEASKQLQQVVELQETGSEKWRAMWNAVKDFVEDVPGNEFPNLSPGAVCALCQQPIEDIARERFNRFAEFMKGEAQTELQEAHKACKANTDALKALLIESAVNNDLVNLVATYDRQMGAALIPLLSQAVTLRDWLIAVDNAVDPPIDVVKLEAGFMTVIDSLNKAANDENEAATKYGNADSNALEANKLQAREQELKLRQQLVELKPDIQTQHDLRVRINCIQLAAKSCDTTAASRENSKLSREYVDKVCASFSYEVKELGLDRVPVGLIFDKSSRGVSYIKTSLVGAPGVAVSTVLSEGEQRVAAIAGFFADLTESGDDSTLIFDDPVCSLDQSHREAVARRLLVEAKKRQVIVFTHDFTFVQYLYEQRNLLEKEAAGQQPLGIVASIGYVHIARSSNGAGEPTTAEEWRHVQVKERIKRLNERIQNVEALYRAGDDVNYEKEAGDIVGAIRATWECVVEQVLLCGVVKRYDRTVQTQLLKRIVDICDTDIGRVDEGMKFTSRWLTGHDAPVSDGTKTISPDQLKAEMRKLSEFRIEVINRREGRKEKVNLSAASKDIG